MRRRSTWLAAIAILAGGLQATAVYACGPKGGPLESLALSLANRSVTSTDGFTTQAVGVVDCSTGLFVVTAITIKDGVDTFALSGSFSGSLSTSGIISGSPSFTKNGSPISVLFFEELLDTSSGKKILTIKFSGDSVNRVIEFLVVQAALSVFNPAITPGSLLLTQPFLAYWNSYVASIIYFRTALLLHAAGLVDNGQSGPGPRIHRIRDGLMFENNGLNAGGVLGGMPFGVWGSVSYSNIDDDFVSTAFDSDVITVFGGIDVWPTDGVAVGLALGYETSDTDTTFNAGGQDNDGVTVLGYAALAFSDQMSADVSFGFGTFSADQFRTTAGVRISSEADSDRWFGAANLHYTTTVDKLTLTGSGGVRFARQQIDAFTESDGTAVGSATFDLGQAVVEAEAAYALGGSLGGWEPFGRATFEVDWKQDRVTFVGVPSPGVSNFGLVTGIGVRYFQSERVSGTFEYNTTWGRQYDQHSFNLLIRAEFD